MKKEALDEIKHPTEQHEENISVVLNDAQYKTADIVLGKIVNRVLRSTIRVSGKLDVPPKQLLSVSIPTGGFLKNTDLLQGSYVNNCRIRKSKLH